MSKRRKTAPHEKLAASLAKLKNVQADGRRVFQSGEFSRNDRERLTKQGFLREVIKGWLLSSAPGTTKHDSTPWYASFWQFCALYCDSRFKKGWHVSRSNPYYCTPRRRSSQAKSSSTVPGARTIRFSSFLACRCTISNSPKYPFREN